MHERIGVNSPSGALQALVFIVNLRKLGFVLRPGNTRSYKRLIRRQNNPAPLAGPAVFETRYMFNQFVIRAVERNALHALVTGRRITSSESYRIVLRLQPRD